MKVYAPEELTEALSAAGFSQALAHTHENGLWIAVVAVGSVVPGVCGILVARSPKLAFSAGVTAMIGGFVGSVSYRVLMWTASVALMALFGEAI